MPRWLAIAPAVLLLACTPQPLTVLDGDTVVQGGIHYRLARHDAPELFHPRCLRERVLAQLAASRLRQLVARGYELQPVACWHGYARDRYGRRCAVVRAHGEDVGTILIREGLAVAFPQATRQRQWCQ